MVLYKASCAVCPHKEQQNGWIKTRQAIEDHIKTAHPQKWNEIKEKSAELLRQKRAINDKLGELGAQLYKIH